MDGKLLAGGVEWNGMEVVCACWPGLAWPVLSLPGFPKSGEEAGRRRPGGGGGSKGGGGGGPKRGDRASRARKWPIEVGRVPMASRRGHAFGFRQEEWHDEACSYLVGSRSPRTDVSIPSLGDAVNPFIRVWGPC